MAPRRQFRRESLTRSIHFIPESTDQEVRDPLGRWPHSCGPHSARRATTKVAWSDSTSSQLDEIDIVDDEVAN